MGSTRMTKIEIEIQISLHSIKVNKKTINTGRTNSASDKPNQPMLKALPLFLSKNREIVVVAVWLDNPCPANRIKKIPINKRTTDDTLEKKKLENDNKKITRRANFEMFISSIFFPNQIKIKPLSKVADA